MARLSPLGPEKCLSLLASVPFGRVVFTQRALPAIRPVNHIVDQGHVVIRTSLGSGLGAVAGAGTVVAYEADAIDPDARSGWSVVVTGVARVVTERDEIARYESLLRPWVDGPRDSFIRIPVELVTGYAMEPTAADG
ncbi:pyridoxamine 5'-phosphate oxidase family protein [Virgisporangium aurantiacum]|uniref:Pyridoxamine 5'-phosphate oxidase n=1 Tax=Virgisporangium aurantiacum TaxID=175570 RepID=A0A8J4DYS7_9ACTN|nr:pyridoxamine 5'-phosphate oxidase family protein [Virgisporangium aurantiacum]GIJ54763.1 hypothetical protein Vau01_022790 [Virgisporangium aurantiacum]